MNNKYIITSILSVASLFLVSCGTDSPNAKMITSLSAPIYISAKLNENNIWIPLKISDIGDENRQGVDILTLDVNENGEAKLLAFRTHTGYKMSCETITRETRSLCDGSMPLSSSKEGLSFSPYGRIMLEENKISYFMKEYNLIAKVKEFEKTRTHILDKVSKFNSSVKNKQDNYTKTKPKYTLKVQDNSGLYKNDIDFKSKIKVIHNTLSTARPYKVSSMNLNEDNSDFYNKELKIFSTHMQRLEQRLDRQSNLVEMRYIQKPSKGYTYTIKGLKTVDLDKNYIIYINIKTATVDLVYPFINASDKNITIEKNLTIHNKTKHELVIDEARYSLKHRYKNIKDFNTRLDLKIPAKSSKKISNLNNKIQDKYKNILHVENTTATYLKNEKINFILQIKYHALKSKKSFTLTKHDEHSAYSLLKD